ncbi:MAG: HAD hydrolase-like protein [Bacteroidales bacterium]|jgi:3-deoxy-D-manno-octulosonate 8-phosphate phosphatase (KDO 8-P phosphatase)|nr:HAD hydrolase-like protein [Bacteroidales bacterium]
MDNYKQRLKGITTFIFDFDGVLTDGRIWVYKDSWAQRCASVKDGYALHYASKIGYNIAVISSGSGTSIHERMNSIGISDVYTEVHSKIDKFYEYIASKNVHPDEVLYMGDDIPDYEVMREAGIACCPADAAQEIKDIAHYISPIKGGEGCVRDVIEQVLKTRNDWFNGDLLTDEFAADGFATGNMSASDRAKRDLATKW